MEEASLVTMGEAMLRLQPIDASPPPSASRHLPQPFLRSVGGDELNVAVALSLLGVPARWVSALPHGPLGDVVAESCAYHRVEFAGPRADGEVGVYTVLPEQKAVHYQRRHSVWAAHEPAALVWPQLLREGTGRAWLHVTGITPLISEPSRQSWCNALEAAAKASIPTSLDLNHRKQLGSLAELWAVVAPYAAMFEVIILSHEQLNGLVELCGRGALVPADADDAACARSMAELQRGWRCKRVALCRKRRDEAGVQRRWSLFTSAQEGEDAALSFHSTHDIPLWHLPKDECGGGSAWAAGFIHALHVKPAGSPVEALRRADLLAALCQETAGDFSSVSGEQLARAERAFAGKEAWLPGAAKESGAFPPLMEPHAAAAAIAQTVRGLQASGVLAIFRAKGEPEVAIARGVELAAMGCRAMEVTLDSNDWKAVLSGLRKALPADVMLGVGTVMDDTVSQIGLIKSLGGTFALSPIDPKGFIEECQRHGILAISSAFTPNECWDLHRRGCRMIKLFHAGLSSPAILKSILDVGPLGQNLNILPSGGVSPANAAQWWDAGAACVGMGSNLVGKDIGYARGTPEYEQALSDWKGKGRAVAEQLCAEVASRFPRK
ncbi:hypothetical protein AB1Y20_014756 [Prymnesium parvum]|uniref:Carbohydrate kinase PfkB domain-containing protein n=1 Tax=Prymnesium parvum TaxID=97485 RepID=A0AB34IBU1_PRYPA